MLIPDWSSRRSNLGKETFPGYTLGREYPCMGNGSALTSILAPVGVSLTFCVIVGKSLHMFGK